jgi:hypothetical protein
MDKVNCLEEQNEPFPCIFTNGTPPEKKQLHTWEVVYVNYVVPVCAPQFSNHIYVEQSQALQVSTFKMSAVATDETVSMVNIRSY